ncbi:MAG: fibronectin type III domain-containing protein [Candidatus Doudnabacteria bacterium]|nr:fibronectin type III domain-containing protein [Candidatus Doudnabacteria bacterium]
MNLLETKKIAVYLWVVLLLFMLPAMGNATDYSSSSFTVKNPVLDAGTDATASANFGLGQSLSQTAIGKSTSSSFQLWSGFQYFFKANANVLTATPGNTQVGLSWTVPQTFLGIAVSSYEVGVGTVSGSYVFTDRGNVTSYTQTGLTNGTPYFFKIKAKTASGLLLVFSNEATATPVAPVSPPPPPPGGGGGGPAPPPPPGPTGTAAITLKGLASPGATVFVLKDGAVAATTTADPTAGFSVTLSNLGTAIYSFTLYGEDVKGVRTSTTSFIQSVTNGVASTVDNIFLGPSIAVDHSIVKQGDTLNIFGYTAPVTDVTIFTNSSQQVINKVKAAANGAWFQAFNTTVLELGSHTTRSQSAKENMLSIYSNTLEFQVGDKSVAITPGECKRSDFNCDGRVNLTDFSILLYFWNQSNPSNPRVDVNKDGVADLVDFSIMLYDWTG